MADQQIIHTVMNGVVMAQPVRMEIVDKNPWEWGWDAWVAIGTLLLAATSVLVPLAAKWWAQREELQIQTKVVSSFLVNLIDYMEQYLLSRRRVSQAFDEKRPRGEKPDVLKHFYSLLMIAEFMKKIAQTAFDFQNKHIMQNTFSNDTYLAIQKFGFLCTEEVQAIFFTAELADLQRLKDLNKASETERSVKENTPDYPSAQKRIIGNQNGQWELIGDTRDEIRFVMDDIFKGMSDLVSSLNDETLNQKYKKASSDSLFYFEEATPEEIRTHNAESAKEETPQDSP